MRQAHRSTALSLLCFHPGEVRQELVAWRGAKVERHSEYANVVEKFLEVFGLSSLVFRRTKYQTP